MPDGISRARFAWAGAETFWSADRQVYAYLARLEADGPLTVAINGQAGPELQDVAHLRGHPQIWFSPDSASVAYLGLAADGLWRIYLACIHAGQCESRQSDGYRQIGIEGTRIGFLPDNAFAFIACKENESIVRVELRRK